jgi:hypothetical protein
LFGQVGNGNEDHAWWGPPEFMKMARPSYQINATHPGSDLAGSVSATMALSSILFRDIDPAYSRELLSHAVDLFKFADTYRGFYHNSITDATGFYTSSHYEDELILGSLALYWATNDQKYRQYAHDNSRVLVKKTLTWTHCWDDASYANVYLLWKLMADPDAKFVFEQWGDYWANKIQRTPDGLAWLTGWGSLRYPLAAGFLMLCYVDSNPAIDPVRRQQWENFALSQMNYALGDNDLQMSWLVGFGTKWPKHAHHRGAHGSWNNSMFDPAENRHLNYEIVGGPALDGTLSDVITNYGQLEGGNDMQAGLVGLAVALVKRYGGVPLINFPPPEPVGAEYMVGAYIGSQNAQGIQINTNLYGMTGWPPRVATITLRYFVNISDFLQQNLDIAKMFVVDSYYNENANISKQIQQWKNSPCVWYADISYAKGIIYPQSTTTARKQAQLVLRLPYTNNGERFDRSADWSLRGLSLGSSPAAEVITQFMAIYENGILKWGKEPDNIANCPTRTPSPQPSPQPQPTPQPNQPVPAPQPAPQPNQPVPAPQPAPQPQPAPSSQCSKAWQQCGGKSWTGPICCDPPLYCKFVNDYYSQCLQGNSPTPAPQPTPQPAPIPAPTPTPQPSGQYWKCVPCEAQ